MVTTAECPDLRPAVPVDTPKPPYPSEVRHLHIEGKVVVEGIVNTDGSVSDLQIIRSADPWLTKITLGAVGKWRYKPALCHDERVRVRFTTTASFFLEE